MINIIIVESNSIINAGISTILGKVKDIKVVCETQKTNNILELINQYHSQLLLIEYKSFLQLEIELKDKNDFLEQSTKILVLHETNLEINLFKLIQLGVLGVLENNISEKLLISSIRKATRGDMLFTQDQITQARQYKEKVTDKWEKLSDRERQIIKLLDSGLSNKNIALLLGISIKTVSFHVSNILHKLDCATRQEASSWLQKICLDNPE